MGAASGNAVVCGHSRGRQREICWAARMTLRDQWLSNVAQPLPLFERGLPIGPLAIGCCSIPLAIAKEVIE